MLRLELFPFHATPDAVFDCEADVFGATFGDTREHIRSFYAGYEDQMVFLALTDEETDQVVAAARLGIPGPLLTKSLLDLGKDPWNVAGEEVARAAGLDLTATWDVLTISVRRDRRHAIATAALYHGLILTGRANAIYATIAILDEHVRSLLAGFGILYRALPGTSTQPYDSCPGSTPTYSPFVEMLDNQRRLTPDAYRLVTLGIGLDGVRVPPAEHFRLRQVVDVRDREASLVRSGNVPTQTQRGSLGVQ